MGESLCGSHEVEAFSRCIVHPTCELVVRSDIEVLGQITSEAFVEILDAGDGNDRLDSGLWGLWALSE